MGGGINIEKIEITPWSKDYKPDPGTMVDKHRVSIDIIGRTKRS